MSSLSSNQIIAILIVYAPLLIIAGHIEAKGKQHGLCSLSQFLSCIVLALLGQEKALPFCLGIVLLFANILFLIRLARNAARLEKTPPAKADESNPRE